METMNPLNSCRMLFKLASLFLSLLPFFCAAQRWRVATAAAIHINQIIVNEKSLRGIMLPTGSLFIFPPSPLRSIWRSRVFSLSFGIQDLLPGN